MRAIKPVSFFLGACAIGALGALGAWGIARLVRSPPTAARESVRAPVVHGNASRGLETRSVAGRGERLGHVQTPVGDASDSSGASSAEEPQRLLALLRDHPERLRADRRQLEQLIDVAVRDFAGPERAELLHDIGSLVAKRELNLGLELVGKLQDFRDRHRLVNAIIEAAVERNPAAAADWAANLAEPALRDSAFQMIGMKWAASDVAAALAWATGLSGESPRSSAVEGLTWTWVQADPKAVYDWAAGLEDVRLREQVFLKMSKLMAVQSPRQALEWALQFPEGPRRDQALHYAMFQWASLDLESAAKWTTQLSNPGLQSQGELAIARSWSNHEAEGATLWASSIRDPLARATALKTTLHKWAETNPVAASSWIGARAEAPLSEDIFASVTSSLAESNIAVAQAWVASTANLAWRAAGERILAQQREPSRAKAPKPRD